MKFYNLKIATLTTALLLALPIAQSDDWTGNIGGSIGRKTLDNSDWESLDKQSEAGFMLAIKKQSWPVSITYDLLGSYEENLDGTSKDEAYTIENHLGIRKTFEWEESRFRPYIGGGITLVSAEIKNITATSSVKDDGHGRGYWVGAGLLVGVTENIDVGFDARYSDAEVTVFNEDLEAGGMHYAATASYRW